MEKSKERNIAENEAMLCEKLEAAFLANISHEIRTPLNAIVGFSTLLSEKSITIEQRRDYLDIILKSSDKLLGIIDDIVEISKVQAGTIVITREKVNINSVISRVRDQFRDEAERKDIILGIAYGAVNTNAEIITDSFKVTQILKNLVDNAIKFTSAGKVEFGYSIKNTMIEFFVSDTGEGISEEYQDQIFNRFYQIDNGLTRRHGGLGLGLAISKAYTGLLGGEIWYSSNKGEGSVFRFTIPIKNSAKGELHLQNTQAGINTVENRNYGKIQI